MVTTGGWFLDCIKLFSSTRSSKETTSFTTIGSIPWMAPEVIQQQDGYGRKAGTTWTLPLENVVLDGDNGIYHRPSKISCKNWWAMWVGYGYGSISWWGLVSAKTEKIVEFHCIGFQKKKELKHITNMYMYVYVYIYIYR